jgi:hypothetical protein
MHHSIHEVVLEILHIVDHRPEIPEDFILILLHEAEDVQKDHSVCIGFLRVIERSIVLSLGSNNFGAFGGDNSMGGGGPPSRGGPSQRGGNRGGGVSDEIMDRLEMSFLLVLALRWTIRW